MKLPGGKNFSCPERCSIPRWDFLPYSLLSQPIGSFHSDQVHETHSCDTRLCPSTCELCKRLCDEPHLHGLDRDMHHLCGLVVFPFLGVLSKLRLSVNREAHPCSALCSDNGICHIETAPQSIEATFTGRHETFQYTKVIRSLLSCAAYL